MKFKPVKQRRIHQWIGTVMVILSIGIISLALYVVQHNDKPIQPHEIRMGAVLFLLLTLAVVVILLLIRNALVMNTVFIIKLRDQMAKHGQQMETLERELRAVGLALDKHKTGIQKLTDVTRQAIIQAERRVGGVNKAGGVQSPPNGPAA